MSSTTDRAAGSATAPARRLQTQFAAARLSFMWFGVKRSLTRKQKEEAAETFDADSQVLTAAKRLLDVRHPAFAKVTAVRGSAIAYWRSVSLPYPEAGLRLLRQDRIERFDRQMNLYREQLVEAFRAVSACC